MKDSERAISTMCDCILKAIDKRIAELKCDREAIVLEANANVCTVLIDNCRYTVKNGTPFEFQKMINVWYILSMVISKEKL